MKERPIINLGKDLDFGFGKKKKERDTRRTFAKSQQNEILYQQDNRCAKCHKKLDPRATQFDHKKPWASGGRTIRANGRALCSSCHSIITHEDRLKKVDKKRTGSPKKKSKSIVDLDWTKY